MVSGQMRRNKKAADEDLLGFYLTREGRDFLRELLPALSARVQFGDGKIASIIADNSATDPLAEVDRTKAAMRRWRKGQAELWRDKRKNERHLKRLEHLFMSVPECREILEDQARTKDRETAGAALALFFYGRNYKKTHPYLMEEFKMTTSLFKKMYIDASDDLVSKTDTECYIFFLATKTDPYLLCQEFHVVGEDDTIFGDFFFPHYSGFGFFSQTGWIHRLMSLKHTGRSRRIDVLASLPPSGLKQILQSDVNGAAELAFLLSDSKSLFETSEQASFKFLGKQGLPFALYRQVEDESDRRLIDFLTKQAWDIVL